MAGQLDNLSACKIEKAVELVGFQGSAFGKMAVGLVFCGEEIVELVPAAGSRLTVKCIGELAVEYAFCFAGELIRLVLCVGDCAF